MKINEVPQDKKNFNHSDIEVKKVLYATDHQGNYTQTQSFGWESENLALEQAWEDIHTQLETARNEIKSGISSPIKFYMIKNRMDYGILSSYVGKWQWQVKRHCKAKVFSSLSEKMLTKYAKVFGISVPELKNVNALS